MSRRDPRPIDAAAAWPIAPDAVLAEVRTLPKEGVLHAWRVLRLLTVCATDPRSPAPSFDRRGMESLEEAILRADYDEALRLPLAVLARCLTPGAGLDFDRLGRACLCAANWAFTSGRAPGVGRSFALAAARITRSMP